MVKAIINIIDECVKISESIKTIKTNITVIVDTFSEKNKKEIAEQKKEIAE
jgi:hypothetical protein